MTKIRYFKQSNICYQVGYAASNFTEIRRFS